MSETWVEWVEPFGPNNEPIYLSVPKGTAIAVQKKSVEAKNFTYKNDEQAFEDFVTVNWGSVVER